MPEREGRDADPHHICIPVPRAGRLAGHRSPNLRSVTTVTTRTDKDHAHRTLSVHSIVSREQRFVSSENTLDNGWISRTVSLSMSLSISYPRGDHSRGLVELGCCRALDLGGRLVFGDGVGLDRGEG